MNKYRPKHFANRIIYGGAVMKKFISMFLSVIIFSLTFVFGMEKPLIAKAEENAIQSFINETVELIKENDRQLYRLLGRRL